MNACNGHENCTILKLKLPQFAPPPNLSLVEHILGMIVEDGFGKYAYFERLNNDQPSIAQQVEVIDKPRFAPPAERSATRGIWDAVRCAWDAIRSVPAEICFTVKSLLALLTAPLRPRDSPCELNRRSVTSFLGYFDSIFENQGRISSLSEPPAVAAVL